MSKLARRFRNRAKKNPSSPAKANPPLMADMLEYALPGLGGFALTRFATRMTIAGVDKKWPSKSKHAGAAVALGTFLAAWFLGHKVKFLAKYHAPLVVGSAIATAINLLQIYVPKVGALIGDPGTTAALPATQAQHLLPANLEEIDDDPAFYTYNDAYDAGRYNPSSATKTQATPAQPAQTVTDLMDDESLAAGVFSGGLGN